MVKRFCRHGRAGARSRSPIQLSASDQLLVRLVAKDFTAHRIAQVLELLLGAVQFSIRCLKLQLDLCTNRGLKQHAATHDLASDSVMRPSERHPRRQHGLPQEKLIDSSGLPLTS
jgi:hypothetical protein